MADFGDYARNYLTMAEQQADNTQRQMGVFSTMMGTPFERQKVAEEKRTNDVRLEQQRLDKEFQQKLLAAKLKYEKGIDVEPTIGAGENPLQQPTQPIANTQPSTQPTQPPEGQAPKLSMPPEIARAPKAVQDKWLLGQTKPSIAGGGLLTPKALEFTARQYLTGDRQAAQGYARNATARIALQNAIVDEAGRQGLSPEQTAAKMAEYSGLVSGARTTGQRSANISLAANEASEMIDIVKETSAKFNRGNFVPWNMAIRAYERGTGSPEIAEFGASLNALVNVYARSINPTGVPTRSDKEHAREVLNSVQSPAQVEGVLKIIGRELEIAKRAPAMVQEATRNNIIGKGKLSDEKEARYQELLRKRGGAQ